MSGATAGGGRGRGAALGGIAFILFITQTRPNGGVHSTQAVLEHGIVEQNYRKTIAIERLNPVRLLAMKWYPDALFSETTTIFKTQSTTREITQQEKQRPIKIVTIDMLLHLNRLV